MRYNDLLKISIVLLIILILFIVILALILKSVFNIVLTVNIENSDIKVKLKIKYLFNLVNIKIPIYPTTKEKIRSEESINKNKKNDVNKKALKIGDFKDIYKIIKKIKIQEVYSDVDFGNENLSFTCFIYVLINNIYSNLINIINPRKIYLNVNPCFTKDYIKSNIKIHIKITIKDIISIAIVLFKIYKKVKVKKKDGGNSEIDRGNSKSYGDNI